MENVIYDRLKNGINKRKGVKLTYKYGLDGDPIKDMEFQGYILGDDSFQYSFVWGYLPSSGLYYKFLLQNIISVSESSVSYNMRNDACYQYAIKEEHYEVLENFDNIYNQAAKSAE